LASNTVWDSMITREDVEHISWLASIKIEDEEKDEFVDQFNSILEYFHQLDEVDTEGVEPTYRVVDLSNVFRDDVACKSLSQEEALKNAPRRENGYFKSPRIV
jgi:aspartyl-tRNA(Asn)/glutamyl-tRNA(Gln) amidotransferase subunit C